VTPSTPADGASIAMTSWFCILRFGYASPWRCCSFLFCGMFAYRSERALPLPLAEIDLFVREPLLTCLRDQPAQDDDGNPLWPGPPAAQAQRQGKKRPR